MSKISATGVRLRQLNCELLLAALREMKQGGTMQELSRKTGLSLATCGTILADLVKRNEVMELTHSESSGGRPARLYACNLKKSESALLHFSIVDNVIHLHGGIAAGYGLVGEWKTMHAGVITPEIVVAALTQLSEDAPGIRAAALSFPCRVCHGLPSHPAFSELRDRRLAELLQKTFEFPIVTDHEMVFATMGTLDSQPALRVGGIGLLHFPEKGFPQAGIAVDGVPLRGVTGFAGEISHLPFGISRAQQVLRLRNRNGLIGQMAETIAMFSAILNPRLLILSGALVDLSMRTPLERLCGQLIPPEHLPELTFCETYLDVCHRGMAVAARASLAPEVQLVGRRINPIL